MIETLGTIALAGLLAFVVVVIWAIVIGVIVRLIGIAQQWRADRKAAQDRMALNTLSTVSKAVALAQKAAREAEASAKRAEAAAQGRGGLA